jgi:hypothetical protein
MAEMLWNPTRSEPSKSPCEVGGEGVLKLLLHMLAFSPIDATTATNFTTTNVKLKSSQSQIGLRRAMHSNLIGT